MKRALPLVLLCGCPGYGTQATSVATGEPTASMEALAVIEQYRDDPDLGNEVFDDKIVKIHDYQVDAVDGSNATMKAQDHALVLSFSAGAKLEVGSTITAVCEGDGISGTTISFIGCRMARPGE